MNDVPNKPAIAPVLVRDLERDLVEAYRRGLASEEGEGEVKPDEDDVLSPR